MLESRPSSIHDKNVTAALRWMSLWAPVRGLLPLNLWRGCFLFFPRVYSHVDSGFLSWWHHCSSGPGSLEDNWSSDPQKSNLNLSGVPKQLWFPHDYGWFRFPSFSQPYPQRHFLPCLHLVPLIQNNLQFPKHLLFLSSVHSCTSFSLCGRYFSALPNLLSSPCPSNWAHLSLSWVAIFNLPSHFCLSPVIPNPQAYL